MQTVTNVLNCALRGGLALVLSAWAVHAAAAAEEKEVARGILHVGTIDPVGLRECSGVAPARGATNLFWMHSDGRRGILYLVRRDGRNGHEYPLEGIALLDWEDLATDYRGNLYVADTGNNEALRHELQVSQIAEPNPNQPAHPVKAKQTWRLRFPGPPFDCESLFIWRGHGYVISKVYNDAAAELYRFPLKPAAQPLTLERLGALNITSPVTGADLAPDGSVLGVVAKNGVYLFEINGDPARAVDQPPLFARFKDKHIEGICYTPDGWLVTAETRLIYLFTDRAFTRPKGGKK